MHVHDEIVIEAPNDVTVEYISDLMSVSPPWAETLELRADGFDTDFYKKISSHIGEGKFIYSTTICRRFIYMMNNIKTFNFEGNEVRTSFKEGNVWWGAKDVCDVLGIKNNHDVIARLDIDEKGVDTIDTLWRTTGSIRYKREWVIQYYLTLKKTRSKKIQKMDYT